MNTPDNLEQLFKAIWNSLSQACHDREHPWKFPVVSNAVFNGNRAVSEQRIVVLRRCSAETSRLFFHTDSRSAKFQQLQDNPHLHWLFWNPEQRVQLRMHSLVTLHHQSERSEKEWEDTPPGSLKVYSQVLAPARSLSCPRPPHVLDHDRRYDREELSAGKPFFVLVEAQILNMDWLSIGGEAQQRAYFKRCATPAETPSGWEQHWSTP